MSTAIKSVKATVNGVEYTLTYNSSTGAYEASVTAPTTTSWNLANHVYPVSVTAEGNTATVDSTDATLGNSLKLRVRETVKPIVSILSPTSGAALTSGTPTFKVKVTDPDSGIDISTLVFKVDGTQIASSKYTSTAITGGYEITYTPESAIADGSHTVTAAVKDNDGNSSETASVTFTIDTVPPTLTISSPEDNSYTNSTACVVSGTTNDVTSAPVTLPEETRTRAETSESYETNAAMNECRVAPCPRRRLLRSHQTYSAAKVTNDQRDKNYSCPTDFRARESAEQRTRVISMGGAQINCAMLARGGVPAEVHRQCLLSSNRRRSRRTKSGQDSSF